MFFSPIFTPIKRWFNGPILVMLLETKPGSIYSNSFISHSIKSKVQLANKLIKVGPAQKSDLLII